MKILVAAVISLALLSAGSPAMAASCNFPDISSTKVSIKGVIVDSSGNATKVKCKSDPMGSIGRRADGAVNGIYMSAALSSWILTGCGAQFTTGLGYFGTFVVDVPPYLAAAGSGKECYSALAVGGPYRWSFTSTIKTTDATHTTPKSEKGTLGFVLPDGTAFVGTMQLKY